MRRRPKAIVLAAGLGYALLAGCSGGSETDTANFCQQLSVAAGPEGALTAFAPEDPVTADAIVEELNALQQSAPAEIEPSLEVINRITSQVINALISSEGQIQDELRDMSDEIAAYTQEANNLHQFALAQCDLDINFDQPEIAAEIDRFTGIIDLNVEG